MITRKNDVIPQNFLFTPQSGGKENLCGIRFGFLWLNRKSDSGHIRIFVNKKANVPE
jgi:hypothetical protein